MMKTNDEPVTKRNLQKHVDQEWAHHFSNTTQ